MPAWPLLGLSWLDVRARAGGPRPEDTGQGLKRACRADKADKPTKVFNKKWPTFQLALTAPASTVRRRQPHQITALAVNVLVEDLGPAAEDFMRIAIPRSKEQSERA